MENQCKKPEVLVSKELFKCPRFSILEQEVQFTDGLTRSITYINTRGGVVILPLIGADQILMLRQYRYTVGDFCWELPAGGIDENESPMEAAYRELEEETGLIAQRLTEIASFYPSNGISNEKVYIYVAHDLNGQFQNSTDDEVIELQEFSLEQAINLLLAGKIPGASSMLALLLFSHQKNDNAHKQGLYPNV